jgi:hypothetical protein
MYRPLIDHYDGVLGEEIALVPIIFDEIMVRTQLVDRTPSQRFLQLPWNEEVLP